MLFVEDRDKIVIVFQHDHADLSGQIAAHWGNERFEQPIPFEEIVYTSAVHDMSWIFWDYYPLNLTSDQKPIPWLQMRKYAFEEFSRFYGIQIRGVGPYHQYATLLLAMHAAGLYKGRYGTQPTHSSLQTATRPEWQDDIDQLEKLQQEAKQQLLKSPDSAEWISDKILWTNYKLLEVWDRLSQYFIGRDDNIVNSTLNPVPLSYGGGETQLKLQRGDSESVDQINKSVTISPYPFDVDPQTFFFKAVVIPNRRYSDEKDLTRTILQGKRINFEMTATAGS
jgi:hypothetical protein